LVNQRGLAVVNVGDDGDIAEGAGHEITTCKVQRARILSQRMRISRIRKNSNKKSGAAPTRVIRIGSRTKY
jgi:hypothetical protein